MSAACVSSTVANTPAGTTRLSGFFVYGDAAWVVCEQCGTTFSDAGKLQHHVYTAAHKEAVTNTASSLAVHAAEGTSFATKDSSVAGATGTAFLGNSEGALVAEPTAAQAARRALDIESP